MSLQAGQNFDGRAPSRKVGKPRGKKVSIVRASSVTGSSLNLVIIIMCFLACLTAGAAYLINKAANGWSSSIASEITVQVDAVKNVNMEQKLSQVASFLKSRPEVFDARIISLKESQELLEPWLGKGKALDEFPFPRLISLKVRRSGSKALDGLSSALSSQFKGVRLDDHRYWQNQIRTITNSLALGALAILALVALATTAIIISATKASMASNKEIVQVLNFVGATDKFIAKEFERHFLRLGIRGGIIGALLALGVFLFLPLMMHFLGGNHVASSQMHQLLGADGLDFICLLVLLLVVIVIAILCMVTSRYSVFGILQQNN